MQQSKNGRAPTLGNTLKGNWFRTGMVSATVVAPLIARWRDLRATKEAQTSALAEPEPWWARLNWQNVSEVQEALRREGQRRSSQVSTGLWLSGVTVGLVAAGVGAFVLVRRRIASTDEAPLVELPLEPVPSSNGVHPQTHTDDFRERAASEGSTPAPSTSGGGLTGAGNDAQPLSADRSGFGPAEVVEPGMPEPGEAPADEAAPAAARQPQTTAASASGDREAAFPQAPTPTPAAEMAQEAISSTEDANAAPFVGNIHTMVFHEAAEADHLPAEENRVYFATEEEATAAGFRRDRHESGTSELRSSEQPGA